MIKTQAACMDFKLVLTVMKVCIETMATFIPSCPKKLLKR